MWISYLIEILLVASLAVSVNLLVGYAGQVSVAHAAFAGIGGYTIGYLVTAHEWPYALAILAAVALAGAVGVLLGLVALGLSEEYLILMTLVFSLGLIGVIAGVDALGSSLGITNIRNLDLLGWQLDDQLDWVILAALVLALVFSVCWRMGQSPYGRVLKGIREDGLATQSLGKNVFRFKVVVFAITSAMAGLFGAVYSGWLGLATPGAFGFPFAMTIFAIVIFGGRANLLGSVLAAAVLTLVEPVLRFVVALDSSTASLVQLAIYGAVLIVFMIVRPQGLLRERRRRVPVPAEAVMADAARTDAVTTDAVTPDAAAPIPPAYARDVEAPPAGGWAEQPVTLEAVGVSKSYGGIHAVKDLDIRLRKGTVTALVGPNGAGKTTTFNALTGFVVPEQGSVMLGGIELVGKKPDHIARLGLVRTFQDVRLFPRVSCLENVMIAVPDQHGEQLGDLFVPGTRVSRGDRDVAEKALRWLDFVGMAGRADIAAAEISYGQSKLVSLARALATEADVLLLDEPASGVDGAWVDVMLGIIDAVRAEGRTVCLVEHNLEVVRQLADHAYFMELGRITDEGSVDQLMSSPRLAEAYFGAQ
ncbi:ATP-binding cassette domain-containing protein [Salinibacterium sp. ZJ450]|uniref:branched-chain amino acid ABC transporter ATP-binding protein/permease n=1 Tax=Salinibacterium sp. ZJ450 TaxID=2708338 RepID=UPI001421A836|nr:branched-chain amino acid ABC transporter ATP-binding protein/permease [Salinibacterium sp. ZJ450]